MIILGKKIAAEILIHYLIMPYIEEYCFKFQNLPLQQMKLDEFVKKNPKQILLKNVSFESCTICKQLLLGMILQFLQSYLFFSDNISDFMYIFKPQWRLKTSIEVFYLIPDLY